MHQVILWNFRGYSIEEQQQSLDRVYSLLIRMYQESATVSREYLARDAGETVSEVMPFNEAGIALSSHHNSGSLQDDCEKWERSDDKRD